MHAVTSIGLSVLVVDDNLPAAELLEELIRQLGHRARSAADGEQAIRLAMVEAPDAVLMDLRMPNVDGYEAARRIKTLLPDVTMIAVSGAIGPEESARARAAGCEIQLRKPVAVERLEAVLAAITPRQG